MSNNSHDEASQRSTTRPVFIKHFSEIQQSDSSQYPGSDELLSIGSPFGKAFNFKRLGIHHEILKPRRRTSWPHAEKTEEEFVYVIEGHPQVWIDGELHNLNPGDGVGFVPGTGIAHTIVNNSPTDVRLLVVGDTSRPDNQVYYPLHPKRNQEIGDLFWMDAPQRQLGPHDGTPSQAIADASSIKMNVAPEFHLTEIRPTDRAAYLEHFQTREIYEHTLNIPFPYTDKDFDFWISFVADRTKLNGQRVQFAIRNIDDQLIGGIGFDDLIIGKTHKTELGYWLAKPFWGRGIMSKAVNHLCKIAFADFKVIRITANIFAFNMGSQRVLEKNGFTEEGICKKHYCKNGKFLDGKLFALVREQ